MSVKKTPIVQVKELFGTKEKLVSALLKSDLVEFSEEEGKEGLQSRLTGLSNTKLLRMHALTESVKKTFKNKSGLVDALLTLQNRSKDKDYRNKLLTSSVSRLYDKVTAAQKSKTV